MTAIRVDNLSKRFQLGLTHAGSVRELANRVVGTVFGRREQKANIAAEHQDRVDDAGHFWALKNVTFDVPQGEVVGIIGKNGAGKSTLLKILSRISSPTEGRITLRGRVASLLEVGTGFHPELTGRENVYLNGTILGMTRREIDAKFDAIVDFAGVAKFIDTPVKRYSSGMTVRLGFAVAAHLDPEILIVDEVLAVGDVEFQKKCLGKMQEVSESGRTVLFVSHNMSSIRSLTSRALLISRGELLFAGATEEAVAQYLEQNSKLSAGSNDVTQLERPFSGLGRELELCELSAVNDTIEEGDSLTVRVGIVSRSTSEDFLLAFTLFRGDATPVGSAFTPTINAAATGDTARYQLRLPTEQLGPGRYYCGISVTEVRTEGRRMFDSLSDVLPFEVQPQKLSVRGWAKSWGAIRFPDIQVGPLHD
ncbi:MAG: ABC transporter ATP-binding protein [Planctomycetaceae bacterium]|nr:ABC transporter ATP-binding protein [Planctomycetaceae bacterium]